MTSNSSNESSVVNGDDSLSSPLLSRWPAIDAIDLYVTPLWYVIGIPGNILAFVVWVQRRMRPSSGCYLAALALDECLFLIMQVCANYLHACCEQILFLAASVSLCVCPHKISPKLLIRN